MFPDRFARFLHKLTNAYRRYGKLDKFSILPEPEWLTNLLSTCFEASTHTEEGRSTVFTLVDRVPMLKYRRGPLAGPFIHALSETKIEPSVEFDVQNLRRLAPAAEASNSAIMYSILSSGPPWIGQSIVGLLHLGQYDWDPLRGNDASLDAIRSSLLIRVFGPGDIAVAFGRRILARLQHGQVVRSNVMPFKASILEPIFEPAILGIVTPGQWDQKGDRLPDTPQFRSAVQRWIHIALDTLLADMKRMRHGGTVLFVPEPVHRDTNWQTLGLKVKYETSASKGLSSGVFHTSQRQVLWDWVRRHFTKRRKRKRDSRNDWQMAQRYEADLSAHAGLLRDGVREVAGFTAVDGAVILSSHLTVRGWGAEIIIAEGEGPPEFDLVQGEDARYRRTVNMTGYGTRHRSAARFVASLKGSMALVVSQDGGAKLLANVNDRLILWQNVEPSTWIG